MEETFISMKKKLPINFSDSTKLKLFILLVVLNLILRYHPAHHEMGMDSLEMHVLANSLSEFGESRWWIHPLAVIGMYPNSYASAISFILSGVSQCSNVDIELAVFIYGIIFGIFSIFASYVLAGALYDDDLFKFLVAFGFSTSQGVLTYSTWTANARGALIMLLPLFLYTLMHSRKQPMRMGFATIIIALLLSATHHIVFYLIPLFVAYFAVTAIYKLKKYIGFIKISEKLMPFLIILAFCLMLAYPFMTHRFMVDASRWVSLAIMFNEYPRYIGIFVFLSLGGFIYLIFKPNKQFGEWSLLAMLMFLCVFVFDTMYMKWFIIIFAVLLAGVGFMNLKKMSGRVGKLATIVIIIFLLSSASFSGFFQFVHEYKATRYVEESTYIASLWIKENMAGRCTCNDRLMVFGLAAISGLPFLTGSAVDDQAYGFVDAREFELVKRPITSDEFWKNSPYKKIKGTTSDGLWQIIMQRKYNDDWGSALIHQFNISYLIENTKLHDSWRSRHGYRRSEFVLSVSNEKICIYDSGNINIWRLS